MDPAIQTKSRRPLFFWIQIFGALIWAAVGLFLVWAHDPHGSDTRAVMGIFGVAAAVCVALISIYLLFPHRRGPYAKHLLAAAVGGLTAISLTVPVFVPLIGIQMNLTPQIMRAIHLNLAGEWEQIMDPYGGCIEIVLIGMAAGWLLAAITSRLDARRLRVDD